MSATPREPEPGIGGTPLRDPEHKAHTPRSEQRRQQVLDAAVACFRRYGFHGASIAKISKAAGMSPGHIYHFFENKEAIIGAIVEQKAEHSLEIIARFEAAADVFGTMVEGVDELLQDKTDPEFAALWLEVLAEAARNPTVAAIVQAADRRMRERAMRLVQTARLARGIESGTRVEAVQEVAMALFEGLSIRIVQNPGMGGDEVLKVLRVAARAVLEA